MSPERKDYFVSYTHKDEAWAEWIAWQLENAGYKTSIQAWDFQAGNNFIIEMHDSLEHAERLLAVLSPDYLNSGLGTAEWAAALAKDPTGKQRRLIAMYGHA